MVADDVYKIIKREGKTVIMITHDVEEACSVASRVVVFTNRPARVKKIIDIDMDLSPIERRKLQEFLEYYDKVWKEID